MSAKSTARPSPKAYGRSDWVLGGSAGGAAFASRAIASRRCSARSAGRRRGGARASSGLVSWRGS
eukprot:9962692-Alexandrium_andersonii.AAC.1